MFKKKISLIIEQAEQKLKEQVNTMKGYEVKTVSFGAIDIDPRLLSLWIVTMSDREKEEIFKDIQIIKERLNTYLIDLGYPKEAVSFVNLTVESQETVDRDYDGNWWYAVK